MDFAKLTAPFADNEIDWRVQNAGLSGSGNPWALILPYVDARAVQNRLDTVLGAANWQVMYRQEANGFLCSIDILIGDRWISKMDGSEHTDIEPFKGGISKAFVRAASAWGIGRYLYDTPTTFASFCAQDTPGAREVKINDRKYYWTPPNMGQKTDQKPTPEASPRIATSHSGSATDPEGEDLGNFVFSFGKFKGKTLRDVVSTDKGHDELISWVNWLQDNAQKTNKPLNGVALKAIKTVEDYLSA